MGGFLSSIQKRGGLVGFKYTRELVKPINLWKSSRR